MNAQKCPECGAQSVFAFVQHGSYFTRCISCAYEGPATSWLAFSAQIQTPVQAAVVDASFQAIESLGSGTGGELYATVSKAANSGRLVLLSPLSASV